MFVDFGSGHNKLKGFKSCDLATTSDFISTDSFIGLTNESVSLLHCRNVIHHLKYPNKIIKEFERILKPNGLLFVIEPTKKTYHQNLCLDILWYRYIIPRYEIWISPNWTDVSRLVMELTKLYVINVVTYNDKLHYLIGKGGFTMTETIKQALIKAGYDFAVAIATEAEIQAGAACGQLSIITED